MTDQRWQYNEAAVGANHPTLTDTVNRLATVRHNNDGTHAAAIEALHTLTPAANQLAYYSSGSAAALADLTHSARTLLATSLGGFGQCRLEYTDATTVTLKPYNGNLIPVKTASGWAIREIPSAGVAGTTSGLSAGTTYLIFLYDNSGTLAIGFEAVATGHSADTDTGVEIITGSATKTLVGAASTNGSTQFTVALTSSWFNRRARVTSAEFTANRSTASTTAALINSEMTPVWFSWANTLSKVSCFGSVANDGAGNGSWSGVAIDGGLVGCEQYCEQPSAAGEYLPFAVEHKTFALSEAYHAASLWGRTDGAGTSTWLAGSIMFVEWEG